MQAGPHRDANCTPLQNQRDVLFADESLIVIMGHAFPIETKPRLFRSWMQLGFSYPIGMMAARAKASKR